MAGARSGRWLVVLGSLLMLLLGAEGINVGITYLTEAVAKGAGELPFIYSVVVFSIFLIRVECFPSLFPLCWWFFDLDLNYYLQSAWMEVLQLTTSARAPVPASTIGLFFSRFACLLFLWGFEFRWVCWIRCETIFWFISFPAELCIVSNSYSVYSSSYMNSLDAVVRV